MRPTKVFQRGVSLISLMVGLLLAMISILAGMLLYRNVVHTTIQTRSDAMQDGQIASAMLTLQLEIQSAGYGIVKDPARIHVTLSADGKTVYWRYATNQCRAFRIHDSADGNQRELQLLQMKNGCNETDVITTLNWADANVDVTRLAEFRKSAAIGLELPAFTLALLTQQCFPYGMGTKDNHPLLTITAENAAITAKRTENAAAAAPNAPFRYDFCLANL